MAKIGITRKTVLGAAENILDSLTAMVGNDPDIQKAVLHTAEQILINDSAVFYAQEG